MTPQLTSIETKQGRDGAARSVIQCEQRRRQPLSLSLCSSESEFDSGTSDAFVAETHTRLLLLHRQSFILLNLLEICSLSSFFFPSPHKTCLSLLCASLSLSLSYSVDVAAAAAMLQKHLDLESSVPIFTKISQ